MGESRRVTITTSIDVTAIPPSVNTKKLPSTVTRATQPSSITSADSEHQTTSKPSITTSDDSATTSLKPSTASPTTLPTTGDTTSIPTTLGPTTATTNEVTSAHQTTTKPSISTSAQSTTTSPKPSTASPTTLPTTVATTRNPTTPTATTDEVTTLPPCDISTTSGGCWWTEILSTDDVTYESAKNICSDKGFQVLHKISSKADYDTIMQYLRTEAGKRSSYPLDVWIGVTFQKIPGVSSYKVTPSDTFLSWATYAPDQASTWTNIYLHVPQNRNFQGMKNQKPSAKLHGVVCGIKAH